MSYYELWLDLSNTVDNMIEEPFRRWASLEDVQRKLDALKAYQLEQRVVETFQQRQDQA